MAILEACSPRRACASAIAAAARRIGLVLLFSALAACATAQPREGAAALAGYWTGNADFPGDRMPINLSFSAAEPVSGTFELPDQYFLPRTPPALQNVSIEGDLVTFSMPAGGGATFPFEGRLRGNRIAGTVGEGTGRGTFAVRRADARRPYSEREVEFSRSGQTFRGLLVTPEGRGPFPAIVFNHGPRTNDRYFWRGFADFFARRGIASLTYDNRGAGSGQTFNAVTFGELAEDALAGVRFVRSQPGIDAARVGLMAGSAGAWVSPIAAARSGDVAFLIMISAPGVSQAENIQYETETRLRGAGVSEEIIARALDHKRRASALIAAGAPYDEVERLTQPIRGEPWFPTIGIPARDSAQLALFRLTLNDDPAEHWARVRVPVLLIYGGRDRNVDVPRSAPRIEAALRRAGNDDYRIETFPAADHGINEASPQGRTRRTQAFATLLESWIERVTARRR